MSEESLTSQDKEELKRHLELLQKEYQRTVQRLQRAERREAIRKHVQNKITEENRLLHINTSAILEQSSSSSLEQLSNPNDPSDTTHVRFHLPDSSPFSTLTCKRSPSRTHRLRFKRSRLRLQIRERESDTEESQEKTSEGTEERWREERGEMESVREWTGEENKDMKKKQEEEKEKKREEENRENKETLQDGLKKNEENLTPLNVQSAAENSCVTQSPLTKLLEVKEPPPNQSAFRNSPSAAHHPIPSSQSCSMTVTDAGTSPGNAEYLTSCTLIEGLPFPVEYYVRTTRRMASAHSSVDLYAVIQSQLSHGRGRRRSSRGRAISHPSSEKPPDANRRKKPGPRGRRGRRRARNSDSSGQSESLLQSPSSLSQEESEPIPSPKPSSDLAPDFQSHLGCELPHDSKVYPIFRKRRGRAAVSHSKIPASINGSSHLVLSLTSLTEALRMKDFRNLGGLITILDVQDFHLPDEEFGQLKLERLCSSCSNAESFTYSTCIRNIRSVNISTSGQVENEAVFSEALMPGTFSESSLPLIFTELSQAETENTDQSEHRIGSQTLDKTQETEDRLFSSVTNHADIHHNTEYEKHAQLIKPNDPHTHSASRSLMLNLSMSLSSHTTTDHNPSLISLGVTPNVLTASPSSELMPFLSSSAQDVASEQSEQEVNNGTPDTQNEEYCSVSVSPKVQIQGCEFSEHAYSNSYSADASKIEDEAPDLMNSVLINAEVEIQGCDISDEIRVTLENTSTCEINTESPKLINEVLICSETKSEHHFLYAPFQTATPLSQNNTTLSQNTPCLSQNSHPNETGLEMKTPDTGELHTSPRGVTDVNMLNDQMTALPDVSANQREDSEFTLSLNLGKSSQTHTRVSPSQHVVLLSCGSLQKTHTLKALEGGCVVDVCVVRWSSDDWCVCVAGEWSVCVWKQKAGFQQWSLLHTWTFTQSVISLQGISDSSALLCVCLGKLEITEARILYCPSTHSEFSQADLYKGALQAVLPVSDHRVTCCSAPGPQQNVQVFTLTQDGRITETLSLVCTHHTIQTLVMVEKENDALIGWTEHKSLLIWNMKSGQLLQTIHLAECVSMATCLRGYSYRGALCVLLQEANSCSTEPHSTLFTLIATNPLTGKYFTLSSITTPSAPTERLIDGDVCESALVAVFQSGLAIWNLAGGVAYVYANESTGVCRLARWAGPNTLLTGYLNGDVNIYHFKPTENRTELKDSV